MTVEVGWHSGTRSELRSLFELAEDSRTELNAYIDRGRVLVARVDGEVAGHLQLVETGSPGEIELKNMAVLPARRGTGAGRALVEAAVAHATDEGFTTMVVATGAADVGNLRFYQRCGFRFLSVERDAFTPANGYPDPIDVDGIPLLDRVWLSQDLSA